MHMYSMIFGAGTVGPFASRAFVPAFITAAMLRFAPQHVAWMPADLSGIAEHAPSWFTSNTSLIIFGILAALEIAATKSPDIRALYQEVDKYTKSIVAVITYLGVTSAQDVGFVERATQQAGFTDGLPALLIGLGVLWMSTLRTSALSVFTDADEDDDIGLQGLLSWGEDIWAFFGAFLLLLFPIVMLILVGIVAGILAVMRRRAEKKEERSKAACANCGEMIYGAAVQCFACKTPVASPRALSVLGRSLDEPTPDPTDHPYKLVQKKRCPVCATRFEKRAIHQTCEACGHKLFADPAFADAYIARIDARLGPQHHIADGQIGLVVIAHEEHQTPAQGLVGILGREGRERLELVDPIAGLLMADSLQPVPIEGHAKRLLEGSQLAVEQRISRRAQVER